MNYKALSTTILFSTALIAVSCHKESNLNDLMYGPITISAVTEGIDNPATKAKTAYKYDVLWGIGDQIIVKGQTDSDTFTLTDGAETTKGTFKQDKDVALSGEVESFYPLSIVSEDSLLWPSEQGNEQVPPMYCKKTITGRIEDFSFRSLGAMLQIVLTTTDSDITLSSIRIADASKPLSGTFMVSDGKAVMTESGKKAIVLNTEDVKIGNVAKYFNMAVPAGKYDNLKLTFFTNDGKGTAMYSTTMPEINHNSVAKISLCAKNFKPVPTGLALDLTALSIPVGGHHKLLPQFTPTDTYNKRVIWTSSNSAVATVGDDGMVQAITTGSTTITARLEDETFEDSCDITVTTPAVAHSDALGGLFSVSDNKIVRFAKGNLYKKSDDSFGFFENQYDMEQTEAKNELMTWDQLSGWLSSSNGQGWQMLSPDEWTYLLLADNQFRKGLYAKHVTVVGVKDCLIIYPDGYAGTKITDENRTTLYNDSNVWAQAQNDGVVCLTPAMETGLIWAYYWISSDRILNTNNTENYWIWYHSGVGPFAARPATELK
ncbi:MAG: Ig-like domain-containing protein [Alistipes sp.]|nr:Ig-like domain-containing protein [Candidatus Alistipes equi]